MEAATSKLTKKYQATIPEPVRRKLQLQAGDVIAFVIEGDGVMVRKARPVDLDSAGLPSASVVRMKLFTLADQLVIRKSGALAQDDQQAVAIAAQRLLGWVAQ